MKNLEFYIQSCDKIIDRNYSYEDYNLYEDIHKQGKNLSVDYLLNVGPASEIPRKTDAFLFVILDENTLIPSDYLSRILSMNNLHRDMAFCCGPRLTRCSRNNLELANLEALYHSYNIDSFSTFISCSINNEPWNYPPISGCVFSGRHYNSAGGYQELITPRGPTENYSFLGRIDKMGPAIYTERLKTYKFLTHDEIQINSMAKWCYFQGYKSKSLGLNTYLKAVLLQDKYAEFLSAYQLGECESVTKTKIFDVT
jgi:hypothetical protein